MTKEETDAYVMGRQLMCVSTLLHIERELGIDNAKIAKMIRENIETRKAWA
jgi:hypothetical protein